MPYCRLRLLGDGDCFFYSAAIHYWNRSGDYPVQEFWLNETAEERPPWYQGLFTDLAARARRNVAEWLTAKVFGGAVTLSDLEDAWRAVRGKGDLPGLGQNLPDLTFDDVGEQDFRKAMPADLKAIWKGLNPETDSIQRRAYASFFIIWYARGAEQDSIGIAKEEETGKEKSAEKAPVSWAELGNLIDVNCRPQVWAYVDQKLPLGGFATRALAELDAWQLNLFVLIPTDPWYLYDYEESYQYVLNTFDPAHFDPLIWFPDQVDAEEEDIFNIGPTYNGWNTETSSTTPIETFASRHTESTMRNPFMLGLAVWNVNHLGLEKKAKLSKWELPGLVVPDWVKPKSETRKRSTRKVIDYSELDVEEENEDTFQPEKKKSEKKDKEKDKDASSSFVIDPDLDEDSSGAYEDDEDDEEDEEEAEKAPLKLGAIDRMVKLNLDWLDVLALNEVNMGVSRIQNDALYTVYAGPKMISVGPKSNSGQKEYYPLLITNRKRDFTIEHAGCFAVDPTGTETNSDPYFWIKPANLAERTNPTDAPKKRQRRKSVKGGKQPQASKAKKKEAAPDPGPLDKLPSYRPVVVHRLKIAGQFYVNVGIVHTTPGGTEFERACVYEQLDQFFQKAHTGAYDVAKKQDHWLICGDFYLFAESLVFEKEGSQKGKGDGSVLADGVKKYLAELNEEAETLIKIAEALEKEPGELQLRKKRSQDDSPKYSFASGPGKQAALQKKNLQSIPAALKERIEMLEAKKGDLALFDLCHAIIRKTAEDARVLDGARSALQTPEEEKEKEKKKEAPKKTEETKEAPTGKKKTEDEQDENIAGEAYFNRNARLSAQIVHRFRNLIGVTFGAQLENKYRLMQPIWGTNIHAKAPAIDTSNPVYPKVSVLRLADFVVCSLGWQSGFVGVLHYDQPGILRVDDDAVTNSQRWRMVSDHFPVGGLFSTRKDDLRVMHIVIEDLEGEKKKARGLLFLMQLYDILRQRLGELVPDVYAEGNYQQCIWHGAYDKAFAMLAYAIAQALGVLKQGQLADAMANLTIRDDTQTVEQLVIQICDATDPDSRPEREEVAVQDVVFTETDNNAERQEFS